MDLTIYNKGDKSVRAIIDDDTTSDLVLLPDTDTDISAERTIELRALEELSDDQVDGGSEPAVA